MQVPQPQGANNGMSTADTNVAWVIDIASDVVVVPDVEVVVVVVYVLMDQNQVMVGLEE